MSTPRKTKPRRQKLLKQMEQAGRNLSDAVVMFHTEVAAKLGLGPSDWKTLGLLEQHGPLTAGELSAHSGLAPASITGIIDRLERGGWVHRTRDAEDGRRVVVELDQAVKGKNLGRLFTGLQRRLDELYAQYSEKELELLIGFITEVAQRQKKATAELADQP